MGESCSLSDAAIGVPGYHFSRISRVGRRQRESLLQMKKAVPLRLDRQANLTRAVSRQTSSTRLQTIVINRLSVLVSGFGVVTSVSSIQHQWWIQVALF